MVLQTVTTCSRQVTDSLLSTVDDWISNATRFVTRQFLQTLKDLRSICNINTHNYI